MCGNQLIDREEVILVIVHMHHDAQCLRLAVLEAAHFDL